MDSSTQYELVEAEFSEERVSAHESWASTQQSPIAPSTSSCKGAYMEKGKLTEAESSDTQ